MTFLCADAIISKHEICARVVELADSLASGASALHGRAGSSPASRTSLNNHKGHKLLMIIFLS